MLSASTMAPGGQAGPVRNLLYTRHLDYYDCRAASEIRSRIAVLCEIFATRFSSCWRPTRSMRIIATGALRQYPALAISGDALSPTGPRALSARSPLMSP